MPLPPQTFLSLLSVSNHMAGQVLATSAAWAYSKISFAEAMDLDESLPKDKGIQKGEGVKAATEKKEEPPTHQLSNPARVVPAQEQLLCFPKDGRWQPLKGNAAVSGILVLKDTIPGQSSCYLCALV